MHRAGRCRWLLVALVTMIMTYPYVDHRPLAALGLTSLVLISGLQALERDGRAIRFYRLVAILQVACTAWAMQQGHMVARVGALSLLALFYFISMVSVLRFTLQDRNVTTENLVGAACGYMLAGFFWAALYRMAEILQPEAFMSSRGDVDAIYFSFVTLCTIGYGDVTPMPGFGRSLAILEGVFGVFYIAVLVSRLVNLAGGGDDESPDA